MAAGSDKELSRFERFVQWLFRPIDNSNIVFFRIGFGAIMIWESLIFLNSSVEVFYYTPIVKFSYPMLEWVQALPSPGMYIVFAIVGFAAGCVMTGFAYRPAITVLFVLWTYGFLINASRFVNHRYLICLICFMMIFIPAHRAGSLDAMLRPKIRSNTTPAWTLYALRFQIFIVYFFGGVNKLNTDWVLDGEPMRQILADAALRYPWMGELFYYESVVYFFTWSGLLLDLLIVPALLFKPTRYFALAVGISFHIMNSQLLLIGIFPWFMIVATLLFLPPDWPRRLIVWVRKTKLPALPKAQPIAVNSRRNLAVAFMIAYVVIQLLLPLRHHLYPGHMLAKGDMVYFAWNMMLANHDTRGMFIVHDPDTGENFKVPPSDLVGPIEALFVLEQPNFIRQMAHHIADEFAKNNRPNVQVRVHLRSSLNHRPPQDLVDPTVDLAAESWRPGIPDWWLPLETPRVPDPEWRRQQHLARFRWLKEEGLLPMHHFGSSVVPKEIFDRDRLNGYPPEGWEASSNPGNPDASAGH